MRPQVPVLAAVFVGAGVCCTLVAWGMLRLAIRPTTTGPDGPAALADLGVDGVRTWVADLDVHQWRIRRIVTNAQITIAKHRRQQITIALITIALVLICVGAGIAIADILPPFLHSRPGSADGLQWWSWILTGAGVIVQYLAGQKRALAWWIGLCAQALWLGYAITTHQWGFIGSVAAYTYVYTRNIRLWRNHPPTHSPAGTRPTTGAQSDP